MRVFRDGVIKNDKLEMCIFGFGPANTLHRFVLSVVKENKIFKE